MGRLTSSTHLATATDDEVAWKKLIVNRLPHLREFLGWAATREAGGEGASLRLENRDDLRRCREVLPLFAEPWWGIAVYSCFDSVTGASVAARVLPQPTSPDAADARLLDLRFPSGSVQHHRAQVTLTRSKRSLVALCEKAGSVSRHLLDQGLSFDNRFTGLMRTKVFAWGRTTCFDVVLRAGVLGVAGNVYRPEKAYLLGSTGPGAGFAHVWGTDVTTRNADHCEALIRRWSAHWDEVAGMAGVAWVGASYDSGDLENALCVFNETL